MGHHPSSFQAKINENGGGSFIRLAGLSKTFYDSVIIIFLVSIVMLSA